MSYIAGYEAKLGMFKDLTKVEFTNLEKILYPKLRITKAQVIEYYVRIAPRMLELLANRPLVMTRYPDGVDKEGFYEKDAPVGTSFEGTILQGEYGAGRLRYGTRESTS